ncbi:MAG TPA: metalloregulator ArsR/SmtB family transcription factor [Candidatus Saccharimonadaceae bacterium]|nr:metalloregulator ArsR/SmtB family transcription factor [Candidatus Saccharimonadaceae bacterium]
MNESAARTRHLLACLGDASRFRLVLRLVEAMRCASELALDVGLSQSCTTRHLQAMERAGIVSGTRYGKRVLFRLRREEGAVDALIRWALQHGASAAESTREVTRVESRGEVRGAARTRGPRRPRPRVASRARRRGPRERPADEVVFDVAFDHAVAGPPLADDPSSVARSPSPVNVSTIDPPASPEPATSARDVASESQDGDADGEPGDAPPARAHSDLPDYLL